MGLHQEPSQSSRFAAPTAPTMAGRAADGPSSPPSDDRPMDAADGVTAVEVAATLVTRGASDSSGSRPRVPSNLSPVRAVNRMMRSFSSEGSILGRSGLSDELSPNPKKGSPAEEYVPDEESDSIVTGHSIQSWQPAAAPNVSRQPTPKLVGVALSGVPSFSADMGQSPSRVDGASGSRSASPNQKQSGVAGSHAAATGADPESLSVSVEDEIEQEIEESANMLAPLTSSSHVSMNAVDRPSMISRGSELEMCAVDAHTVGRGSKIVNFESMASSCRASRAGRATSVQSVGAEPLQSSPGEPVHHADFETYHAEQQAVAALQVQRLANNDIGFLDKLERVRRGHQTATPRSPDAANSAAWPLSPGGRGGRGPYEKAAQKYESNQFDELESKLQFEERQERDWLHTLKLLFFSSCIVCGIGIALGVTSSFIAVVEGKLFSGRFNTVMNLLWPCCSSATDAASSSAASSADEGRRLGASGGWAGEMDCSACAASHGADERAHAADVWRACAAFVGLSLAMVLGAALLCYWAPRAALSGLPQVKAYLNGTRVPGLLRVSTLVAKAVGITLVVSTALPLGKEGPMVHIGAIIASGLSRLQLPGMRGLLELRTPQAQRVWVGMGAAAGVAAAFNAPVGGILYSFEEVCSHWPSKLTWRAFFCVIFAAFTFVNIMNSSLGGASTVSGSVVREALVLNQDIHYDWQFVDVIWCGVLGVVGGVLGAGYTKAVCWCARLRKRIAARPRLRIGEALLFATLFFLVAFWLPFAYDCVPCDEAESGQCSGLGSASSASSAASAAASGADGARRLFGEAGGAHADGLLRHPLFPGLGGGGGLGGDGGDGGGDGGGGGHARRRLGGGGAIFFIRWQCPERQYSAMATLFQSGQEGVIKHLLQLTEPGVAYDIPTAQLGWFLLLYYLLSILLFGIGVPSGNFVPAMTIGACFGRLLGELLRGRRYGDGELVIGEEDDTGKFALLGAAAMLGGVTRMTLALAVLLVEVTKDTGAMLFTMTTLAVAKVVGDLLSPSFDDAMIHVLQLPYLEEEPPHEFELLTVRDVMANVVVVLKELERVGDLHAVLKRTKHNGFPVVDVGKHQRCTFFAGQVLRRQLLLLLRHRVWELQERGEPIPKEVRHQILDATRAPGRERGGAAALELSDADKECWIDLRPFLDPCPIVVNELMPLRRVYKLFNTVGLRHLTVVDCREQVVGIVTRKDVLPEVIEERAEQLHGHAAHGHAAHAAHAAHAVHSARAVVTPRERTETETDTEQSDVPSLAPETPSMLASKSPSSAGPIASRRAPPKPSVHSSVRGSEVISQMGDTDSEPNSSRQPSVSGVTPKPPHDLTASKGF